MAQEAVRAESRRSRVDGNTTPPGFQDSLDELQTAVEDGVFDVYEEDGTVMLEPQATEADDLGLPEPASDRARKARKRAAGRGGADGNEGEN